MSKILAQEPFVNNGEVYMLDESGRQLIELTINPSNNAIDFVIASPDLGVSVNAIGMRRTDNLIYGIDQSNNQLVRIDKNGVLEELGAINLDPNESFKAGDVSNDGRFLVVIGSSNNSDVSINKIDLTRPDFPVERIDILAVNINFEDIAADPSGNVFFGYDNVRRNIVRINTNTAAFSGLLPIEFSNDIYGLFFDPFGSISAYGSTINGVVSGLFNINRQDGKERRLSTGALFPISDMAASPYTVAMRVVPEPQSSFPCTDIEYKISVANQFGSPMNNVSLDCPLPNGVTFNSVVSGASGNVTSNSGDPSFNMQNFTLANGISNIVINVEVGDMQGGDFFSQASLQNLPTSLGSVTLSDDPRTLSRFDQTRLRIIRIDEDSLFFNFLVCEGSSVELDASGYGNNLLWNTGSTASILDVGAGGIYILEASSDCQTVIVEYDVVFASCPFTVELGLDIFPDTTLKCSKVEYYYIIENDSGDERKGAALLDTLPEGFERMDVVKNPFGGKQINTQDPRIVQFENITLPNGQDTLILEVFVGNIEPKAYPQRATLYNLPSEIGKFRYSDDPKTGPLDSTRLEVFGTLTDSLIITEYLCEDMTLTLDATPYGMDYQWFDGYTEGTREITEVGFYDLILFNGCDTVYLAFDILAGPDIDISFTPTSGAVFQGETLQIISEIYNEGDSLFYIWNDPFDTTLTCVDCLDPLVISLFSTQYLFKANNEICQDSAFFRFDVDNTRFINAPNIFSPNQDGVNELFTLYSPNYGKVKKLQIFNRWGNKVFDEENFFVNTKVGWDGKYQGNPVDNGVYIWIAEIEFIDQTSSIFNGNVTVIK